MPDKRKLFDTYVDVNDLAHGRDVDGYARVDGLGGAYGNELLYLGKRDFSAPFQDLVIQYRGGDISWRDEWREFRAAIREGREPIGSGVDGLAAMRVATTAYEAERQKRILTVDR